MNTLVHGLVLLPFAGDVGGNRGDALHYTLQLKDRSVSPSSACTFSYGIGSAGGGGGAAASTKPLPKLDQTACVICLEPFVADETGCFPVVRSYLLVATFLLLLLLLLGLLLHSVAVVAKPGREGRDSVGLLGAVLNACVADHRAVQRQGCLPLVVFSRCLNFPLSSTKTMNPRL